MNKPRIIFRVDGGPEIGMGHIVRSMNLADVINDIIPSECVFVTKTQKEVTDQIKNHKGNFKVEHIESSGSLYGFYKQFNPQVVVTDVPILDEIEKYIRTVESVPLHVNLGERYFDYFPFGMVVFPSVLKVKSKCSCESKADYYVGAKYVLIDPCLKDIPNPIIEKKRPLKALIAMGGADPGKFTYKIVSSISKLANLKGIVEFHVVVGPANPDLKRISDVSKNLEFINIIKPQPQLYDLIRSCDIAITSGGTTAYETIAAGRPTWIIPQIEFEVEVAKVLMKKNAISGFGFDGFINDFLPNLPLLRNDFKSIEKTIINGRKYIDGRGMLRIADKITNIMKTILTAE